MNVEDFLLGELKKRAFRKYLDSEGVKRYRYFGNLPADFEPTIADAGMFLFESRGARWCSENGIEVSSGKVIINGKSHFSALAAAKANMDRTVAMWLEDVGTVGFSMSELRREVVPHVGEEWFNNTVLNRVSRQLCTSNYNREEEAYSRLNEVQKVKEAHELKRFAYRLAVATACFLLFVLFLFILSSL